ncbi:hypothetical protein BG006_001048 [Podila minutissima]|uniref:histidine kinase n=1 Tax=Podila minutissima TaxID=64525 RepID=A0A9P5SAP9_9FUNG|nr:hypothetical protein BG006_001048 [Podila minutissima]
MYGDPIQLPRQIGLAAFLLWLNDHPSSAKVGSENLARFLLVKMVSLMAASLGSLYGLVFGMPLVSASSALLFFIPAVQGATGATRLCGLVLASTLVGAFLSLHGSSLLGPSFESALMGGLPLITGFLIGRSMGLLTCVAVLAFSIDEYHRKAVNMMSEDDASRLWAGFGAYWMALLFFGSLTFLYQWCIEVCVRDVNLFKDIAVANAKSKDGVVSSVSHELRTPLAALIGWTELLLSDQSLSSSARSTVSMLHSSTLSLLTILNALLDVSKVSAAKMTICQQNFNLHDLVLDTVRMMTGLSGTQSVELLVDFSSEVPELVRADCGLIKQVLGNLISNAIKFTDVGYVKVGVALKGEDDDTVTVEFVVQDTGKGIAEEQKSKLFVEFSQVEGGKCKTNEAGTGLGLFLVKNLVELMNGSVFVSSKLGVGSTFGFSIKMEKQYLAFRTPGYDHVVTVSSALQANPITDSTSAKVPVTPGLACSTTPQISAEGRDQKTDANKDSKDYFNLQPVEDRANANNITLRTRDNALLSNRPYYFHSQCGFFEEFLCNTTSSQWNALSAKRLSYEECLRGWGKNQKVDDPLSHFGDVYLIDVSPTTNRPKNTPVLTDQEHTCMFLEKLSQQLISRAQSRIGKARQGSLILFYPFGHPPSVTQGPLSYLSAYYQITLCRKPVSERALGSMVKKLVVRMQEEPLPSTPGAMNPWSDVSPEVDPTLARVAEYSSRRSPRVVEPTQRSASLSSGSENEQTTSSSGSDKEPTFSFEGSYKDSLDVGSAMEQSSPSMENFRLVLPRPDSKRKNMSKLSYRKAVSSTETEESSSLAQVRNAKKKNLTTSPLVTESTSEDKIKPTLAKYHPKIKRNLMSSESVQDLNESGKNVLIVDDNPLNRGLLYQQLKNLGVARIDRACSGQEAVDLFQPGVHAIVLMDLKMPTMSGFQATALLREKECAHFGSDSSQHATESTRMLNNPHDCGDIRAIGIMDNCPWSPERFASPVSKKSRRTSSPLPEKATVTPSSSSTDASSETLSSKSYARKCATIVAVTADWTAEIGEDREKALNGGFDDVMVKPMSLQSLTVLLDRYVH